MWLYNRLKSCDDLFYPFLFSQTVFLRANFEELSVSRVWSDLQAKLTSLQTMSAGDAQGECADEDKIKPKIIFQPKRNKRFNKYGCKTPKVSYFTKFLHPHPISRLYDLHNDASISLSSTNN